MSDSGLRGLVNLGNTCFMNCIIQALLHVPMLRDYFLSDQHHCRQMDMYSSGDLNRCLMCELAHIFQEFYGGGCRPDPDPASLAMPYIPHRMLHLVWLNAEHLAGYEQHDAHEFLISALNVLHRHSQEFGGTSLKVPPYECKCIIDRLFTGQLQSDLTCTKCGRVSTTVDPYWDISLELLNGHQSLYSINESSTNAVEKTLYECLENFVRPENLGCHSKIKCDTCGSYEESTKQLTLRKLPIIACFHLKRFEHTASATRQKINNPVRYPELIDLTPYTTKHLNASVLKENTSRKLLSHLKNRYSLIAVVNHTGSTESGHYSCLVRHHRDYWYNCNDQIITREKVENVLNSNNDGYLLFYSKLFIDYD